MSPENVSPISIEDKSPTISSANIIIFSQSSSSFTLNNEAKVIFYSTFFKFSQKYLVISRFYPIFAAENKA